MAAKISFALRRTSRRMKEILDHTLRFMVAGLAYLYGGKKIQY